MAVSTTTTAVSPSCSLLMQQRRDSFSVGRQQARIMSPSIPPLLATLQTVQSNKQEVISYHHHEEKLPQEEEEIHEEDHITNTIQTCNNKKPSCCRRLIHQFDKEYTFHPKLNPSSIRLVATDKRQPLLTRLQAPRNKVHYDDKDLTFSPRLNSLSIKLAQERAKRPHDEERTAEAIQRKMAAAMYSEYTFKPVLLGKSIKMAEKLEGGFLDRQQQHLARKQQLLANNEVTTSTVAAAVKSMLKFTPIKISRPKQASTPHSTPEQQQAAPPTQLHTVHEMAPAVRGPIAIRRAFHHGNGSKRKRSQTAPCINNETIKNKTTLELLRQTSDKTIHRKSTHNIVPLSHSNHKNTSNSNSISNKLQTTGLLQLSFSSLNEADRVKRIRVQTEKIIRAKKLFQIKGGYKTIRKALKNRGWVEIIETPYNNNNHNRTPPKRNSSETTGGDCVDDGGGDSDCDESDSEIESEEEENDEEYLMMCRAVKNTEPHLIWALRKIDVGYHYLKKDQIINHFSGAWFTTKFGLCESLQELPWYGDIDASTFFPRCYLLNSQEDKNAFEEDYQLTAVFNVLKLVACQCNPLLADIYGPVSTVDKRPLIIISSSPSLSCPSNASISSNHSNKPRRRREPPCVPEELLLLAIRETENFISQHDHSDLEYTTSKTQLCSLKLTPEEWSRLLNYYYNLTIHNGTLYCSHNNARKAEDLLQKLSQFWPQIGIDGFRNTWIIKPGAMSRGRGIICKNKLQEILQIVSPSIVMRKNTWVVQKYIERPLLIYSTKFDIRQWFLVTDWNPLTMWMYKDCYLRFSSQLYSLEKLDTSIHLCNNSVQKHMTNSHDRDERLPLDNMWDSNMFQRYLKSEGESTVWDNVIYPGMRKAIISVLQVSQDRIIDRKNTFELYGADFMIGTDYTPWLIEVNCSPTMEKSTAVTKRLCRQVMEDTIKVVVDRRLNKDCDIGSFELAYKQSKLDIPPYTGVHLSIEGSAIRSSGNYCSWRKPVRTTAAVHTIDLNETI